MRDVLRRSAFERTWLLLTTGLVLWALVSIQNERWNNVHNACERDNQHYAQTVLKLDRLIAESPPDRRARARVSRAATLALIATLAPPHVDALGHSTCDAVADAQVSRWP